MYNSSYTDSASSISRDRINHMLSTVNAPSNVSFSAGAGYGKSTAAAAFLSSNDFDVIWVSLTPLDNYYIHFWETIINSTQCISQASADELEAFGFPQDMAGVHQLILLISRIVRQEQKTVLVLDNYHLITENRVKNLMEDIVCANIHNLMLFILSREKIDFLERQKENTLFLTEKELAFSIQETQEYFSLMDISVSDDILFDIYHNKTHGWPFAIYLAAISLKNHPGITEHSFSFSDKLIYDTIDKEVFSKFPSEDQALMIKLSLMDFYPKKLIEDVFDKINVTFDSSTLLQNTFILYNRHADVYQLHQLFRDFLQSKTHLLSYREKTDILLTCGNWYKQNDLIIDALNCYRRISNHEKIWELISHLLPTFVSMDFSNMLLEIIDEFPEDFRESHPMVYHIIAALHILSGHPGAAVEKCHDFIEILKNRPDTPGNHAALGELYLSQGFAYMYTGSLLFKHCFELADQYLTDASLYYKDPWILVLYGNPVTLGDAKEGALEAWTSTIEQTAPLFDKLLGNSMIGIGPLTRATAYYYQNNLKSAEVFVQKALHQSLSKNNIDIICQSYHLLMLISVGKGDYNSAIKYLNIVNDYITNKEIPSLLNIADIAIAWFYAQIGLDVCIPPWIADKTMYASDSYIQAQGSERLIKAHCLLNDARYDELIGYLLATQDIYHKYHRYIGLIYSYVLLAIAYYKINQTDLFIQAFHTAYEMSYNNDIVVPIVEIRNHSRLLLSNISRLKKGEPLKNPELQAMLDNIDDKWLTWAQKKAGTWTKMIDIVRNKYLIDNPIYDKNLVHLSRSEQEVMQYLSDGLTREEIADFIGVSTNTAKSVIRSVYNKLGARNSAHAVYIAMKRNIIF